MFWWYFSPAAGSASAIAITIPPAPQMGSMTSTKPLASTSALAACASPTRSRAMSCETWNGVKTCRDVAGWKIENGKWHGEAPVCHQAIASPCASKGACGRAPGAGLFLGASAAPAPSSGLQGRVEQIDAGTLALDPRPAGMVLAIPHTKRRERVLLMLIAVAALVAFPGQADHEAEGEVEAADAAEHAADPAQLAVALPVQERFECAGVHGIRRAAHLCAFEGESCGPCRPAGLSVGLEVRIDLAGQRIDLALQGTDVKAQDMGGRANAASELIEQRGGHGRRFGASLYVCRPSLGGAAHLTPELIQPPVRLLLRHAVQSAVVRHLHPLHFAGKIIALPCPVSGVARGRASCKIPKKYIPYTYRHAMRTRTVRCLPPPLSSR